MNEMVEAVTKWIPIYLSGRVEPYFYPRLRDGVYRRTLFIVPRTAAVLSSSVQQNTDGMLNLFLTDRAAQEALSAEYGYYLALCRPLMQRFNGENALHKALEAIPKGEGTRMLINERNMLSAFRIISIKWRESE